VNSNGIQRVTVGRVSQFGRLICCSLNSSTTRPIGGIFHTWESTKDGRIRTIICGERITIDQTLIIKQFGINVEGVMDATNALVKKVQVALKNIIGSDAFVNKE